MPKNEKDCEPMIEAVVFDMDGLMFDTEKIGIETWKKIAEEWNYPKLDGLIFSCFGTNHNYKRKYFAEVLGENFPYDDFVKKEIEVTSETLKREGIPHKRGLTELLVFLRKNGIKCAVATSTPEYPAVEHLKNGGVFCFFDAVVTGDMTEKGKPCPDIYLKACDMLGVEPENALGLEDSYNGVRAICAAGMKAVMIPDMVLPNDEIKEKCFAIKQSLLDVIELVKLINGLNDSTDYKNVD